MQREHYKNHYAVRTWKKAAATRAARRERLGISQELLASRLGVSDATISRWENGVIRPHPMLERAWDAALYKEAP